MNNLGGYATRQRPNQITLILAASNQTDLVVKLVKELPADFSGAVILAQTGTEEIEHIPAEYLPRPIGRTEGRFDLKNCIETEIVVEQHDLLQPSSHRDLDLIVCPTSLSTSRLKRSLDSSRICTAV